MQYEVVQVFAAEHRVAWHEIRPYILLHGDNPYKRPVSAARTRRCRQRDRLVDRRDFGQRIRFDTHRTHLAEEGGDIASCARAGSVVEQTHRHVEPVVGGTPLLRIDQRRRLPGSGDMATLPSQTQHIHRLGVVKPGDTGGNLAHNPPQVAERANVRVMTGYGTQSAQHLHRCVFVLLLMRSSTVCCLRASEQQVHRVQRQRRRLGRLV